jgi:hypothetical protein
VVIFLAEWPHFREGLLTLMNLLMGMMFWTSLTSMMAMMWFFPMYKMYFTGYELSLACLLLPGALLGIPTLRQAWMDPRKVILHYLPLMSSLSWFVTHQGCRLLVLSLGTGFFLTDTVARCLATSSQKDIIPNEIYTRLLLGLMASVVLRIFTATIDLLAPNLKEGWAPIALIVGLLIVSFEPLLLYHTYPTHPTTTATAKDNERGGRGWLSSVKYHVTTLWQPWFWDGISVGYLFLISGFLLTESTTISRWALSETLPHSGVNPFVGSLLTTLFMLGGLGLSLMLPSKYLQHPVWLFFGMLAMLLLSFAKERLCFLGGIVTAAFLMSIWPHVMKRATMNPNTIGRTWGVATATYILGVIATAYCMCYNFVPGGMFFREKTHYVLLVGLAAINATLFFNGYWKRMFFIASSSSHDRLLVYKALGWIVILLIASAIYRLPRAFGPRGIETVIPKVPGLFGVMIWTVHFSYDDENWFSHRGLAALIRDSEMDVIGLLETDTNRFFKGNRDLVMWLAEELHMYSDYGLNSKSHNWGCALLSKYPIVRSQSFNLPSPQGENACIIHATLAIQNTHVDVVVSHFGTEEFPEDRRLQSLRLAEVFRSISRPLVFLGYLVTKPNNPAHPNYLTIVEGGRVKDIYAADTDRWCQYILYQNLTRQAYARVSCGVFSDTEVQIATFHLNRTDDFDTKISGKNLSDPHLKLPDRFLGNGIRGHHYILFHNTSDHPIYFAPSMAT